MISQQRCSRRIQHPQLMLMVGDPIAMSSEIDRSIDFIGILTRQGLFHPHRL